MASSSEYRSFILEQLSGLDGLSCRKMMGEYILYHHGKIAAYICDDRLLVKPVPAAIAAMKTPVYEAPYLGAKEMLLVEEVDDRDFLRSLFEAMYHQLPVPAPKRTRGPKQP